MKDDIRYLGAQIEETNSNVKAILEIVIPMRQEMTEIKKVLEDIPIMKADIETIKLAVKHTNVQVQDHERRITKLESRPA